MKAILKFSSIFMLLLFGIPILSLGSYVGVSYLSNANEIRDILASTDPENRSPPELVRKYVRISFDTNRKPSWPVARMLTSRLGYASSVSSIRWQLNWFVWFLIADFFIKEDDSYALFCVLANIGNSGGLNGFSVRHFEKPMSKLNELEVAELLAYERAPQYFSRNKAALDHVKDKLLSRAKNI